MLDHFRGGQPLKDVFFGDSLFNIPEFQRDYAWTRAEVSDLLRDFGLSPTGHPPSPKNSPLNLSNGAPPYPAPSQWASFYFLGQIVLLREDAGVDTPASGHEPVAGLDRPDRPQAGDRADVVDGQQRLTTLTILLACLRDRIETESVKQSLHDMIAAPTQRNQPGMSAGTAEGKTQPPPAIPLLNIGQGPEGAFLRTHVQTIGATLGAADSDPAITEDDVAPLIRLKQARVQIAEAVDALAPEERNAFAEFLRERCLLAIVITADRETGWDVFARLNKRGRPLLESERLKTDILRDVPEPRRGELVRLWDRRKRMLGSAFDEGEARRKDLFSYIRDGYAPKSPRRTEDRVLDLAREMGAERFMDEVFEPASSALAEVTEKRLISAITGELEPPDEDFAKALKLLDMAGAVISANTKDSPDAWKPPVLLFFAAAGRDTHLKRAFVRNYDRFLHILLILHGKRNKPTISRQIARLTECVKAEGAALDFKTAFELPNMKQVEHNLITALEGSVAKLILLRVACTAEGLSIETAEKYGKDKYNIEHVLPEKITHFWSLMLGSDDKAKSMRSNIGNLVLTDQWLNSKLGNRSWAEKKRMLRYASVLLPFGEDIKEAIRWDSVSILARQDRIVKTVNQLWGLSGSGWDVMKAGERLQTPAQINVQEHPSSRAVSGLQTQKTKRTSRVKTKGPPTINRPRREFPPRVRAKRRGIGQLPKPLS
ncbi:MAG: DUF262 domain-containing HNH endonuclease family protein [Pseudomonadota bacterium]